MVGWKNVFSRKMKFFFHKWVKNCKRCVPSLARVRYDANVQMQYQSQRSLVAVHKSAFAKAALTETENRWEKRRASYAYREAKRKQDTSSLDPAKKE